jgi:2'-5' RNA ligase
VTVDLATTIGVSIPIPPPEGEYLQRCRAEFGDPAAQRIPAHITLVPPTPVCSATYPAFVDHCASVTAARAPFDVVLRGTGTFRPVSDVVFIQVARGVSDCERLETELRAGPVRRDLDVYYHPHVTVAHNVPPPALDRAFHELADFTTSLTLDSIHHNELGDDEVWRPVKVFPLQGA